MATLEPRLAEILKACGLGNDAVWAHKQSGKYIMYHWACEQAAATKGIKWEPPVVVHADPAAKMAVVLVTGRLGDQVEWSFGEAAPYNTTQTYPFAMAEKRAKDRVVLKLIGLHGLAYSEEEADDFKPGNGAKVETHGTTAKEPAADKKAEELEYWRKYVVELCERIDEQPTERFLADLWVEETVGLQKLKAFSPKAYGGVVERFQKRGLKEAA